MGYYADSVDVDFIIETENIPAALDAVNKLAAAGPGESARVKSRGDTYTSLIEAVEDFTSFEECIIDGEGFYLGHHSEKYFSSTDDLLMVLAPFATEGSYVRFSGEGGELFGFQVSGGELRNESGHIQWRIYQ